jgi:hypothetical protein
MDRQPAGTNDLSGGLVHDPFPGIETTGFAHVMRLHRLAAILACRHGIRIKRVVRAAHPASRTRSLFLGNSHFQTLFLFSYS